MSNSPNNQYQHTFHSIQEIRDYQFKGNYASDSAAFNAIDIFVRNISNTLPDRAEAVMLLSLKGMGLAPYPAHYTDRLIVNEYLGQSTFDMFVTQVNQFVDSYNKEHNETIPYPEELENSHPEDADNSHKFLIRSYALAIPHNQCGQAYCDWYLASH